MGIDIIIKMRISKGDWMKVSAVENDREKRCLLLSMIRWKAYGMYAFLRFGVRPRLGVGLPWIDGGVP